MTNSMLLPPEETEPTKQKAWIASGIDPVHTEWTALLSNGTKVLVRPIREDDVDLERRFIDEGLSPESRRFRFRGTMKHASPSLLKSLTHLERNEVAFVALVGNGAGQKAIGVARFSARNDLLNCECAVAVSDEWHKKGLATLLMGHLIDVAQHRGIQCMYADSSAENHALYELAKQLGFKSQSNPSDATEVIHTLELQAQIA